MEALGYSIVVFLKLQMTAKFNFLLLPVSTGGSPQNKVFSLIFLAKKLENSAFAHFFSWITICFHHEIKSYILVGLFLGVLLSAITSCQNRK